MKKAVKRTLWIVAVMMVIPAMSGQETFYYGVNSRPVETADEAIVRKEVTRKSDKNIQIRTDRKADNEWEKVSTEKIRMRDQGEWMIKYRGDRLFSSKFYREYEETGQGGYLFSEYTLASTIRTGSTTQKFPLSLQGTLTEYHPNGKVKSVAEYQDNQLIANQNWLEDGSRYIDSLFYSADQEPEYEYGPGFFHNYLLQKITRSEWDLSQIQDQVIIGWVVMETGELRGVVPLQGRSDELNHYLVNAIATMPGKWQPAMLNGKPVRYFMQIPINFDVRDINFQELDYSTGHLHYSKY